MIKESGRVIAIDDTHLWVETINQGTCGTCAAEKGCGQSLLSRWMAKSHYLKVALDGRSPQEFAVNDEISLGIPENVVVQSSLVIYCLPLLLLIIGAALGQVLFATDLGAISLAIVGLVIGGLGVRVFSWLKTNNRHFQPMILDLIENRSIKTAGIEN